MIINNLIIQLIGYLGLFFLTLRFFYDKRRTILNFSALANFIYSIHWYLLNAYTASGITLLATFRNLVFKERITKKWAKSKLWLYLFLILIGIIGILTWNGILSLLPLTGSLLTALASWSKKSRSIRILNTTAMIPWFVYAMITGSQPVMISSTIIFISGTINIYRFDTKFLN